MTRRRAWHGVAIALASACACSGHRAVGTRSPVDMMWPAANPRVRLHRVIDLQDTRPRGSARLLEWLGGDKARAAFQRPYAVAWDHEDLLVADPDAGRVARVGPDGKVALSPDGAFLHPVGIAVCPQGILVSDAGSGRLGLVDGALRKVTWLAEDLVRPTGIGCDDNRVFVAETGAHRIRVLGRDAMPRTLGSRGAAAGAFNFPAPLALDAGDLLVGDTLNFRIQRLDPASGRSLKVFGQLGDSPGETPRIKGLAVDAAGHLWVSDAILDQVSLYDRDGRLLLILGERGSGPGQFSFPAGIAAHPDGRVVVADSLNRRLQVFRLLEGGASRSER